MISKYIATLAVVVSIFTLGLSYLQFASRSQVVSGSTVDETLNFEFTLDAGSNTYYTVSPGLKEYLEDNIRFHGEGAARVLSSEKVVITPKEVSWTVGRTHYTATGAGMVAHLQWDTPADSASGSHGAVYMEFPPISGMNMSDISFHSGGTDRKSAGVFAVREVTAYRSAFEASVARFVFALPVGLPFGALLHTIGWAFVLKGEKAARIAAFPPQGSGLPQTFYPSPIKEWINWSLFFGIGLFLIGIFAWSDISNGFISPSDINLLCGFLAITVGIAYVIAYFTRKNVLTFCIAAPGISYARGRGQQEWLNAPWGAIAGITHKSRTSRGSTSYWTEIQFLDKRKKLTIDQSVERYTTLRDLLTDTYNRAKAG